MLPSVKRQLFSRLLSATNNKCIQCFFNVRLKSFSDKKESSKKESTKMEIAVLKNFSESLQIESVDFPKISHSKEVAY
jgi:hypothetical protein